MSQDKVRSQYQLQNQREDEDQTIRQSNFAFVDQDAISVGDGFEHLNSGLGLLVVLI
jgi:hypothetical protein